VENEIKVLEDFASRTANSENLDDAVRLLELLKCDLDNANI